MSTFVSPARQLFSIPYNYVLYMIENPSTPEVLQKLYQTCKYFFPKNPILMPPILWCDKKVYIFDRDGRKKVDTKYKFWPVKDLNMNCNIVPEKFYRFSPKDVTLRYCTFTSKEFDMIIAGNQVERLCMFEAYVGYPVDEIIAKLPNAVNFYFANPEDIYTREMLQKLGLIKRKKKIMRCRFGIHKTSENFLPSLFTIFLQRNGTSGSEFEWYFGPNVFKFKRELELALSRWSRRIRRLIQIEKHQLCVSVKFD